MTPPALTKPQRRVLEYLADHADGGPEPAYFGASAARSARALERRGLTTEPRGRYFAITPAGRAAIGR